MRRGVYQDLRNRAAVQDVVPVQPSQVHLRDGRRAVAGGCRLAGAHRKGWIQRLQQQKVSECAQDNDHSDTGTQPERL